MSHHPLPFFRLFTGILLILCLYLAGGDGAAPGFSSLRTAGDGREIYAPLPAHSPAVNFFPPASTRLNYLFAQG